MIRFLTILLVTLPVGWTLPTASAAWWTMPTSSARIRWAMPTLRGSAEPPGEPFGADAALKQERKELQPRLVNLSGDAVPLSEALKMVQEQTGNTIVDRRKIVDNPKLKLNWKDVTFFQALDELTAKARCSYSLYQDDGSLALVDGPRRKLSAAYPGICRVSVKRVTVFRDEESGQHLCNVLAELTWEPRFEPIYVDIGEIKVTFAGRPQQKAIGPGQITVEDRTALEFEMRLPAPPRKCESIESLSAAVKLIGPAKMLTFRLADLKPLKEGVEQVQDDVKVVFKPLPPLPERWSFDVVVYNPPGVKQFDSHEFSHWMTHNRIYLEKVQAGKTSIIRHRPEEQSPVPNDPLPFSFKRAAIRYHFTDNLPTKTAGWALVYRTPGRIVDLPLRFTLKNIPLP